MERKECDERMRMDLWGGGEDSSRERTLKAFPASSVHMTSLKVK